MTTTCEPLDGQDQWEGDYVFLRDSRGYFHKMWLYDIEFREEEDNSPFGVQRSNEIVQHATKYKDVTDTMLDKSRKNKTKLQDIFFFKIQSQQPMDIELPVKTFALKNFSIDKLEKEHTQSMIAEIALLEKFNMDKYIPITFSTFNNRLIFHR